MVKPPDFNGLARSYRWLELLSLGPWLQRARTHFLQELPAAHKALLLGDGDGRFCAALLRAQPELQVEAVDASPAMLQALLGRCGQARVVTTAADLREFTPQHDVDLVATHFVLDCLEQPEVDALAQRVSRRLAAGGTWLFSDFHIPAGALHWPARAYVRSLYLAFRLLTGLRVTRLPDHASAFRASGLELAGEDRLLGGLLLTQLWRKR